MNYNAAVIARYHNSKDKFSYLSKLAALLRGYIIEHTHAELVLGTAPNTIHTDITYKGVSVVFIDSLEEELKPSDIVYFFYHPDLDKCLIRVDCILYFGARLRICDFVRALFGLKPKSFLCTSYISYVLGMDDKVRLPVTLIKDIQEYFPGGILCQWKKQK